MTPLLIFDQVGLLREGDPGERSANNFVSKWKSSASSSAASGSDGD
jgi:hypothetical protein